MFHLTEINQQPPFSKEVNGDAFVEVCFLLLFLQVTIRLAVPVFIFWNLSTLDCIWFQQEFKGYVFKTIVGCDKQGCPMKQGVWTPDRVRLLLHVYCLMSSLYIIFCLGPDLSLLNLEIVKKGDNDLTVVIDVEKPMMRGPKMASKIRKLFKAFYGKMMLGSTSTHTAEPSRQKVVGLLH